MPDFKPQDLILPGVSILSDGINAVVDGINTRANRRWQEKMTQWQRDAALTDWGMQNEYNSPASQMERLKKAGLNPNLVYGNGASAGVASPIRGASTPGGSKSQAPQNMVSGFLNAQQMQLQNDNLKAQNTVLLEQAKNIAQDTLNKKFGTDLKEFDFNFKTENRNRELYKKEQQNINLFKSGKLTDAQIANTLERTKTDIATRQPRVQSIIQGTSESLQRVLNMRIQAAKTEAEISYILTQVENAAKDGTLKDIDIQLKKHGVSWSDPAWQRKILSLLNL